MIEASRIRLAGTGGANEALLVVSGLRPDPSAPPSSFRLSRGECAAFVPFGVSSDVCGGFVEGLLSGAVPRGEAPSFRFRGVDVIGMAPEELAARGLHAMASTPPWFPGMVPQILYRSASTARRAALGFDPIETVSFSRDVRNLASAVGLDASAFSSPMSSDAPWRMRMACSVVCARLLAPSLIVVLPQVFPSDEEGGDGEAGRLLAAAATPGTAFLLIAPSEAFSEAFSSASRRSVRIIDGHGDES